MVRIGGLASGMDIDTIVGDLMKAERMPLDKLKQKKQTLEWQRDDYRSMNSLLLNFRTELTNMKLTSQYRSRTTSSTNSDRVMATASTAAAVSSYSISKVDQLASAATLKNAGPISATGKEVDAAKGLFSERSKFATTTFGWKTGSVETATINVTEAKKEFQLDLKDVVLQDISSMNVKVNGKAYEVVTALPAAGLGENQVLVDTAGKLTFKDNLAAKSSIKVDYFTDKKIETLKYSEAKTEFQLSKGSIENGLIIKVGTKEYAVGASLTGNEKQLIDTTSGNAVAGKIDMETGKFKIDAGVAANQEVKVEYKQYYFAFSVSSHTSKGLVKENFGVQGTESLNNVVSRVTNSDAGVTMFYDSFSDQLTLTRKETGNFNGTETDPEIVTTGNFINTVLQFGGQVESGGVNAKLTINGLDTERTSNTFEMSGVTFTLKQKFDTGPAVDVNINNDSSKVFDNIKAFVTKYNELIDKIQKKTSEELYRSYKPLTDEQRESLSDKQQEQWEEKAKSGLLRRDSILTNVLGGMRNNFYAPVKNSAVDPLMSQLASIGIKTTANYMEGGKLEVNDAELKKAIESNPESVENLFRGTGTTSDEQGIIHRLYDTVNGAMDKLKERAGNTFSTNKQFFLGRQMDNVESQIDRFESRLTQVEDRYWRQFTAMEKAIQKANSQSAYLMQQFSGA